ncbi:hypothetical protein AAG570_000713 [Ranatra chinensis]|uniref:ARF7 effector protein C-terminal domain-containing protein n=1 Tax=Ranatra chinensis TaxID=642074 RepID=A0ABD0YY67_9HEMI
MADRLLDDTRNFLENFNPNTSERENRKLTRMIYQQSVRNRSRPYDEKGLVNGSGEDLCDCRRPDCPGCFFPCKKCSSDKCGPVCRANRKFVYKYLLTPTSGNTPVDIDEDPVRDRYYRRLTRKE